MRACKEDIMGPRLKVRSEKFRRNGAITLKTKVQKATSTTNTKTTTSHHSRELRKNLTKTSWKE